MTQKKLSARSSADDVVAGLDLSGRRIVVTGANTGIGYDTARALAAAGAEVILACRNAASGAAAAARIRAAHDSAKAEFERLDLASFAQIAEFSERLGEAPVDALICNAGLASTSWETTEEGFERTVGVCHIGHALLTRLLMGRLLAAPAPRLIMVSSESHRTPRRLHLERLPVRQEDFKGLVAYGQAKLCNVLFANGLQARYGDQGLMACSLHPGTLVSTDIGRGNIGFRLLMKLVSPLTKSSSQGAATSVYAAVHEPAASLGGAYLRDCAQGRATDEGRNPETARRLLAQTDALLEETCAALPGGPLALPPWP